jgi:hypothetical protein
MKGTSNSDAWEIDPVGKLEIRLPGSSIRWPILSLCASLIDL